jgi:hypothetical protein
MGKNDDAIKQALATLAAAQDDYSSQRAGTAELLSRAQIKREEAMRRVAALGISHRQIGNLTNLSHTRVNQILGTGRRTIPEAHVAPDFGGGPSTVRSAIVRLMAAERPRSWTRDDLRRGLAERNWPSEGLDAVVTELATEAEILSADEGRFTIHGYDHEPPS